MKALFIKLPTGDRQSMQLAALVLQSPGASLCVLAASLCLLHVCLVYLGIVFDTGDFFQVIHHPAVFDVLLGCCFTVLLVADLLYWKKHLLLFDFIKSLLTAFIHYISVRRPVLPTITAPVRAAHGCRAPPFTA